MKYNVELEQEIKAEGVVGRRHKKERRRRHQLRRLRRIALLVRRNLKESRNQDILRAAPLPAPAPAPERMMSRSG